MITYFQNMPNTVSVSEEAKQNYNRVFRSISDYKTLQIAERSIIRLFFWQNEFRDLIILAISVNYLVPVCSINPLLCFFILHHMRFLVGRGRLQNLWEYLYIRRLLPLSHGRVWCLLVMLIKDIPNRICWRIRKNLNYVESFFNANKKRMMKQFFVRKKDWGSKGHFWDGGERAL